MEKKKNKGFSMVELIIVIAIMAILAGALAPALIKYINKSRLSADIQTGNGIASAITSALTDETILASLTATTTTPEEYSTWANETGNASLLAELQKNADPATCVSKASKDVNGATMDGNFYVVVIPEDNQIEVYAGATDATHMVYPTVGSAMED